ncbi:hypothetical protein ACJVC5_13830 [Peredibacter sp. HCB2-198]|uniref:hypothetical protein n=1 Tax=Peredibacter sp. HCB2-198 TaxID=3383025 RepID=UPI0038B64ED5
MGNQNNQEHSSFYDQADGKFNEAIEKKQPLRRGVMEDEESDFSDERTQSAGGVDPDQQVRETEDASLQDESYSFDEQNTDNEEYHDASGAEDIDLDNDDDFIQ